MSIRIVAGTRRGATLATPPGPATRPTLGRVRESLFMILTPWLPGARVLDLYAGSGALGLEALSRGAAHAVFVERARPALDALRRNIERLRFADRAEVIAREARAWLAEPPPAPFDLIVLDPPYGHDEAAAALTRLAERSGAWLGDEAVIAAQVGRDDPLAPAYGELARYREQAYAQTRIAFYRVAN